MGYVYADITLRNAYDSSNYMRGTIQEPDIRQIAVTALVDTGAGTLIINEALQHELGLNIVGEYYAVLANREARICKCTEPVEIHWGNRHSVVDAVVLEGADEVLLGAIPLERMDLIVDPNKGTLIGAHGDTPIMRI